MSVNLSELMTNSEKDAVNNFILANIQLNEMKLALWQAEDKCAKAARSLTSEIFRKENGSRVSCIPESFVAHFEGKPYLIRVDIEGDDCHKIELIGGVV